MAQEQFNQAHFFGDLTPTKIELTVDTVANFAVGDTISQAVSGATGTILEIDDTTPALIITPVSGVFTYAGANAITNSGSGSCVASALTDVKIEYSLPGNIRANAAIIEPKAISGSGVAYYKLELNKDVAPIPTGIYVPGAKKLLAGYIFTTPIEYEIKKISLTPYTSADVLIQAGEMGYICFMGAKSIYGFSLTV